MLLVLTCYFYARNEDLFADLPPSSDRESSPEYSRSKSRTEPPRKHPRRMPSTSSEASSTTRIVADNPHRVKGCTVQRQKSLPMDQNEPKAPPQPPSTVSVHADVMANIDKLRHIRILMEQWTSGLGPVDQWPRIFQEGYDEACRKPTERSTQEEIDDFLKGVASHVENGRSILHELRRNPVISPPSSMEGWGEFLIAGDLMDLLYRGISLLEVRLEILAPSCVLPSGEQSAFRKWKGLDNAF